MMASRSNWDTSVEWAMSQQRLPGNLRLFTSPCGVRVAVKGLGVETALLLMHWNGMTGALMHVLTIGEGLDHADPRCLADFYAWYGVMDRLAQHLQESPEACRYLSDRYRPGDQVLDVDVGRTERGDRLVICGDLARSALAAHAARSALKEL
jgi:hypothetical protein